MCITTAIVANLPVISTSISGVVASKVAYKHLVKRGVVDVKNKNAILTSKDIAGVPRNEVVSVSKIIKEE